MRKSYKIIVNLILAFLLACICVGTTYAWYVNKENLSLQLTGSATSYFSEGDGTQASPFIIANKQHVYNFAYFQNRGDFNDVNPNDSTGLYYFKIDSNVKTIDMEDVVLPPIGNDTYPFKGVFNGSGCTLKNVTITTDKSRLPKSNPSYAKDYAFSLSVGLFGKTASTSQISNFILENPVVEVASSNSLYATSGTKTVGLAIGDVGYKAASIGVKGGKLNVRVSGYTTYNSILGNVKEGASSSVTGGGKPTSGQSIGFGGSLDILSVYQRMYLINQNGWATPQVTVSTDTSSSSHPNKGYALPLMVGNDVDYTDDTYYNTHTSETVNKNNIGYYTGNDTKINAIKTKDRVYASDVTYASDNTTISDIKIWTKRSSTSGSQSDIEVTNIDESIKNDIVKQLNNTVNGEKIFYGLRLNSQVSQNNPVNLSSMTVAGNTYTSTSYIPANAVWFVAQRTGIAKIVLAVAGNGKQGFSLYQVSRDTNSQKDKTNPYNASISGVTVLTEIKDSSGTVIYNADWAREMTENRIYYYEIPVTEGVEYALGQQNSNGSYLMYIDVGQNSGDEKDTGEVDASAEISGIDFIYQDVAIAQSSITVNGTTIAAGNFVLNGSLYQASATSVYFESVKGLLYVTYVRTLNDDNSVTFKVDVTRTVATDTFTATKASKVTITYTTSSG